jgi:hypothetical protein
LTVGPGNGSTSEDRDGIIRQLAGFLQHQGCGIHPQGKGGSVLVDHRVIVGSANAFDGIEADLMLDILESHHVLER